MNIEMCRLHPDMITIDKVNTMKETVTMVINETTKVIQNLRPTVLDDLGFEAGIIWLIDRNLKEKGITCYVNLQDLVEEKLPPELQVTLVDATRKKIAAVQRIITALDELELGDWLRGLPEGLDTLLASGGHNLSAGEAQLFAFVFRPP